MYNLQMMEMAIKSFPISALLYFYFHHKWNLLKVLFHFKNFDFFLFKSNFPLKIIKREKGSIFFRLSRAVAVAATTIDRNLCTTYSLDHKT
jgi:hypothetical protein